MVMAHSAMAPRGGSAVDSWTGDSGDAESIADTGADIGGEASETAWGSGVTGSVVFSRLTRLILSFPVVWRKMGRRGGFPWWRDGAHFRRWVSRRWRYAARQPLAIARGCS